MATTENKPTSEAIRNLAIVATSAIPLAGGPLSVILDKYLPSELEQRRTALLDHIAEDLEGVKSQLAPGRLESPEFLTLFIKILRRGMEEHQQEKIVAFRNILMNSALSTEAEFDETAYFVRIINDLTVDQIRILHLFYRTELLPTNIGVIHRGNLNEQLLKVWPKLDPDYLQAAAAELFRFMLISSSAAMIASKSSMSDTAKPNRQHALTRLGERFVDVIFKPIEMRQEVSFTDSDDNTPQPGQPEHTD